MRISLNSKLFLCNVGNETVIGALIVGVMV